MNGFKHNFRDFTKSDYLIYSGAIDLPTGDKPKICNIETKDDVSVDLILSGDGAESTLISLETESKSYIISIPGYNSCHSVIADSLVDYFQDYEVTEEAIRGIVSDYDMTVCY